MYLNILKKILLFSIIILLIFIVFHIINLLLIYPWNPEQVVYGENLAKSDLIVVLDGEYYYRIDYAFKLAEEEYSDRIYYPSLKYWKTRERVKERLLQLGDRAAFFEGDGADSTYEEALLTKEFCETHNIKRLILVTSPYHSYRAHWIFEKVIPEAEVISSFLHFEDNWFSLDNLDEDGKKIIEKEQFKFFIYYLLYGWRFY